MRFYLWDGKVRGDTTYLGDPDLGIEIIKNKIFIITYTSVNHALINSHSQNSCYPFKPTYCPCQTDNCSGILLGACYSQKDQYKFILDALGEYKLKSCQF